MPQQSTISTPRQLSALLALVEDVQRYYDGPFKDEILQERFELKVEAEAKPGAIIIANRKVSDAWTRSSRFQLLLEDGTGSWIFRKLR